MKVYGMVTEQSGRARYVKFGMASDVSRRRMEVQCGCPLRIEYVLSMDCPNEDFATAIEAALHIEHDGARSSGEWFRWAAPNRAVAEAREAMLLIGQREMGAAAVSLELAAPKAPRSAVALGRYRNASARALASAPVVGDVCMDSVRVVVKRRKPAFSGA